MTVKNVSKVIEELAQRYYEESIGAIDHGINARAIALKDKKIRQYLEEHLSKGYTLVRVSPLSGYGSQPDNCAIVFEFRKTSPDRLIDLDRSFLRVAVNLPARVVANFEEASDSPFEKADTPFVVAVPSGASEAITLSDLLDDSRQRERNFMRGMGISDLVRTRDGSEWMQSTNNTFWDTSISTTSQTDYSTSINSGYTPDTINDYRQDPGGDTGYKTDGKVDPDREGLLVIPTDRPILILPKERLSNPITPPVDPPGPGPIEEEN
jgi:hypothetical protein